jgi:hypothetical protein
MRPSTSLNPFRLVAPEVTASLARWWAVETLLATLLPRAGRVDLREVRSPPVVVLPFLAATLRPA